MKAIRFLTAILLTLTVNPLLVAAEHPDAEVDAKMATLSDETEKALDVSISASARLTSDMKAYDLPPALTGRMDKSYDETETFKVEQEHSMPFAAMDVTSGLMDTVSDATIGTMTSDTIANASTITNTTLNLTEPGVAAGHEATMLQAQMWLMNNYLGHSVRLQQLNSFSELDNAKRAYVNCISKRMKDNTEKSWLRAMQQCAGENYSDKIKDDIDDGFESDRDGTDGMTADDHPDSPSSSDEILLSNYIFNTEGVTGEAKTKLENYATAFRTYVGDQRLKMKADTSDGRSALYEMKDGNIEALNNPKVLLRKRFQKAFGVIIETLFNRCLRSISLGSGSTVTGYEPFAGGTNLDGNKIMVDDPWSRSLYAGDVTSDGIPAIKHLSLPDFQMRSTVLDPIYKEFMAKENAATMDPGNCVERFDWEFSRLWDPAPIAGGAVVAKVDIPSEVIKVRKLAGVIASGKQLVDYMHLERMVGLTAAGSANQHLARVAIQKIRDAAGTNGGTLQEAYAALLADLENTITQIQRSGAAESGRGLPSLRGTFQKRNGASNPSPWTIHNNPATSF